MEDKIEVGEYVRLERGDIFKIDEDTVNYYNSNIEFITNEIVKHSKNIIDLIEVGDVIKVLDNDWLRIIYIDDEDYLEYFKQDVKDGDYKILSIVTEEQFKQIEYIVKE